MPPSRAARTHGKSCSRHAFGHSVHDLHAFMHGLMSGSHFAQGCMKSGQVLTDRRYKWFEPEYWRFGDPASAEGQINYMRHASGQVRALSPPQAPGVRFFSRMPTWPTYWCLCDTCVSAAGAMLALWQCGAGRLCPDMEGCCHQGMQRGLQEAAWTQLL